MDEFTFGQFGEDDAEDREEEEGTSERRWGTRDGLIFLIDASEKMFAKNTEDESPFERSVKCAKNVIQNKIIGSDKDLMGIVFFGTEKSTQESEFKHIFVFHDLGQPSAERVLKLENILEKKNNDNFKENYGHNKDFSIADALWICSNLFANCGVRLGYKRILLFTNEDNPHSGSQQLRRQASAKAEDLHQNGIDLELMHMSTDSEPFDTSVFYKDILFFDGDEETVLADPSRRFEELLTRVRKKYMKKRTVGRLNLNLGKDVSLSVGVYNLVHTCTRPAPVKLCSETNEEVKSTSRTYLKENAQLLLPQDLQKCVTFGSKRICFEPEELTAFKNFGPPGLRLMGFKKRSFLKPYYHIRPSQFIYPDETSIEGSTSLFSALLMKCLERDVVAVCWFIPRKNTPPRLVILLPQKEELDANKVQVHPPGFHIIFLPFADDFRKVKVDEDVPRANPSQVEKAKQVIKKLQFAFQSANFENPQLQRHYTSVEAMALDRENPDEINDFTLPDEEEVDKRVGHLVQEFKDLVFPEGYNPGQKRKATSARGGTTNAKQARAGPLDIEAEARAGMLNKLTVPVLRDSVKTLNIKTTATKKADLIDVINTHFGL